MGIMVNVIELRWRYWLCLLIVFVNWYIYPTNHLKAASRQGAGIAGVMGSLGAPPPAGAPQVSKHSKMIDEKNHQRDYHLMIYLLKMMIYLLKMVIYLLKMMIYLLKMVIYLLKMVIYLLKMVIYLLKMVIYLLKMVIFQFANC